jgi:actin-related protein 5
MVGEALLESDFQRYRTRSPFDQNVVFQFELMEHVLDYVFHGCGVTGDRVAHPIVLTEALCNPNYSRARMSELLFETYQVPAVCYGVDALFSYHHNVSFAQATSSSSSSSSSASSSSSMDAARSDTALLISSGWTTTHMLPVVAVS